MNQVKATAVSVAERVSEVLGTMAKTALSAEERSRVLSAQQDLQRNIAQFHRVFKEVLGEKMAHELALQRTAKRAATQPDWESLSLVADEEVDEKLHADRIAQMISHECDGQLRELGSYMNALTQNTPGSAQGNPLRPDVLGNALYRAIEEVSDEIEVRRLLARDLGQSLARAMPECYAGILKEFKSQGIKPAALVVRSVEGPGVVMGNLNSGYATLARDSTRDDGRPSGHGAHERAGSRSGRNSSGAPLGPAAWTQRTGGDVGAAAPAESGYNGTAAAPWGSTAEQADAQMMQLLRRLTLLGATPSGSGGLTVARGDPGAAHSGSGGLPTGLQPTRPRHLVDGTPLPADPALSGLMAVNLIHAHRDELKQATAGRLDHMVIDVVGSLFDQILSDSRVPPHMARQIARLQLPVLRVALRDSSFFSSRRHPVRRLVNRIASLGCGFEDFDDGPGLEFLNRVQELVREIVDGDFDQLETYEHKLGDLEDFIARQAHVEIEHTGARATIEGKESELRVQQRYMQQLRAALEPLSLPAYLGDFLSQIWSQALALTASRDGVQSERMLRYRRTGRDLVMSVQPHGSAELRKNFLLQLPALMKDLNEGMKYIDWPESAQQEFFAKLLPAHAESLKGKPLSDLDRNMLIKRIEAVLAAPIPGSDSSSADPVARLPDAVDAELRFTPEEAQAVGLVVESSIDWSGAVDIDVSEDSQPPAENTEPLPLGLEIELNASPSEPEEPTRGPQLMENINLGFAYQMHLKDEWRKVRLTYVSPGRQFFVFTRGKTHRETISVTSRMLARMCETGRIRGFEKSYLIERATLRARRQLAALQPQVQH